jgi:hypothetical protein
MGALLAKCPATGKEFFTDIYTDRESLIGLRAIVTTSICPHCGGEHAWRIEDARYVHATPLDLRVAGQEATYKAAGSIFSLSAALPTAMSQQINEANLS